VLHLLSCDAVVQKYGVSRIVAETTLTDNLGYHCLEASFIFIARLCFRFQAKLLLSPNIEMLESKGGFCYKIFLGLSCVVFCDFST